MKKKLHKPIPEAIQCGVFDSLNLFSYGFISIVIILGWEWNIMGDMDYGLIIQQWKVTRITYVTESLINNLFGLVISI